MSNHPIQRRPHSCEKQAAEQRRALTDEISLEPKMVELVRLRVAQICSCQPGMLVHREALKSQGESVERIQQLNDWRKSPLYEERERAALAMGETLASDPSGVVSEEVLRNARLHFTHAEMIQLTLTIFAVTDWNYQCAP